ncbi:MAG: ABC transporter ATP-binding protein [Treponema sp.]|jgi:peptide/nickel transport system ATP-binding protein|nr:ABC transporter ATP-binding protein [Treponema sp.]
MALLEVRNLSTVIRRKQEYLTAVDGISFDIEAGEIIGLAGESGCGKTLSALSITGLLPPVAEIAGGEITLNITDNTVSHNRESSTISLNLRSLDEESLCRIRGKEISMIFQEPRQSLNPLLRIGAQISETLELHGAADKKTARAAALDMLEKLKFTEPEKIFNAYPHQLSGGMCQRVMIAIAAICRPRLLIADEPSSALDTAIQEQLLTLLGQINRDFGTAILFISHDLSVVRRFCRRFLVMYAGKIVEEGPAQTLFSASAHPYTQGLIGAIPGRQQRGKALANIPGKAPSIEEHSPGCPFAPRCPRTQEQCRRSFPPQTELAAGGAASAGHIVRCFVPETSHD